MSIDRFSDKIIEIYFFVNLQTTNQKNNIQQTALKIDPSKKIDCPPPSSSSSPPPNNDSTKYIVAAGGVIAGIAAFVRNFNYLSKKTQNKLLKLFLDVL